MSKVSPKYDYEFDLFDFFKTLWNGKWIITGFIIIAVLLGRGLISLKDPVYESNLYYSIEAIPPFYDKKTSLLADFQKKFYSPSIFEEWKKNNTKTSLVFEDISPNEYIDGFPISKDKDSQLVQLLPEGKSNTFVIRSNQLPILNDIFNYSHYISELLNDDYAVRSKEERKKITQSSFFKDFDFLDSEIIIYLLDIERYIDTVDKGGSSYIISYPSIPKKISPKSFLILALSAFLGGLIGVIYVILSSSISKQKG